MQRLDFSDHRKQAAAGGAPQASSSGRVFLQHVAFCDLALASVQLQFSVHEHSKGMCPKTHLASISSSPHTDPAADPRIGSESLSHLQRHLILGRFISPVATCKILSPFDLLSHSVASRHS